MRIDEIRTLRDELKRIDDEKRTISEIDTQIFLIEPVLQLAGWDLCSPNIVKRTSRSYKKQEFDIELYKDDYLRVAIECKAIGSNEFNIKKIGTCGKLKEDFSNLPGDGIGQMRSYCHRYAHFVRNKSLSILTNGSEWIIFSNDIFLKDLHSPLSDSGIQQRATLDDPKFEDKIIKTIAS